MPRLERASSSRRSRRRSATAAIALLAALVGAGYVARGRVASLGELLAEEGLSGIFYRLKDRLPGAPANVRWETAEPERQGFSASALEALWRRIDTSETSAFLVARGGQLIFERYAPGAGPNQRRAIAALGKSVTAALVLLIALSDERLALDDPASRYVRQWRDDPVKRGITVRQLVAHSSGLDDVNFLREQSAWKQAYLEQADQRFRYAVMSTPLLFEPGARYSYSGIGYYVLAYAAAVALSGDGDHIDLKSLLARRIMEPLGIPRHDWVISYQTHYEWDGYRLYALGSGGAYTPRALATIGQLLLDRGEWRDRRLLDARWVDAMLSDLGSPQARGQGAPDPPTGIGVWLNRDKFWPSLPRDAAVGAGGGHQILLLVPSLDLVVVRLGRTLGRDEWEGDFWQALEPGLFRPLMAARLAEDG
jgi:CubicO group peptidase (beta-lactamase class C family)